MLARARCIRGARCNHQRFRSARLRRSSHLAPSLARSRSRPRNRQVSLLVRNGADLGVRDSGGANAFHYAASEGHIKALAPLIAAAKDEGAGSLARYLAQGDAKRYTRAYARARAGPRARTRASAPSLALSVPTCMCSSFAHPTPLLALLALPPSLLPPPITAALHWAAQYGGGAPEAARMLLKAGAKVDARAVKCVLKSATCLRSPRNGARRFTASPARPHAR